MVVIITLKPYKLGRYACTDKAINFQDVRLSSHYNFFSTL